MCREKIIDNYLFKSLNSVLICIFVSVNIFDKNKLILLRLSLCKFQRNYLKLETKSKIKSYLQTLTLLTQVTQTVEL
jgi:hypothetical protein